MRGLLITMVLKTTCTNFKVNLIMIIEIPINIELAVFPCICFYMIKHTISETVYISI